MKLKVLVFSLSMLAVSAHAQNYIMDADEFDPKASNIEEVLMENELEAEKFEVNEDDSLGFEDCYRENCKVYLEVSRKNQRARMYINGVLQTDESGRETNGTMRVTTGGPGHETPRFDQHPQMPLRAYSKYSSTKYPGGNWINPADGKGYGNMPYVIFIRGGYGVHGTTGTDKSGNIALLGTSKARSHGCVRIHPKNAIKFNAAVREYGAKQTWIRVID